MEQIGKSVTYEWSLWYKKPLYIQHNFIIVKYSIRQRPKAVINKLTFIHIYTHPSTDFSQQEFVCLMSVLLLTLIQPTTISKRSTLQSQPSCCPIKKNPFLLTPPLIFFFFFGELLMTYEIYWFPLRDGIWTFLSASYWVAVESSFFLYLTDLPLYSMSS